jgi:HlyD family secretion protein
MSKKKIAWLLAAVVLIAVLIGWFQSSKARSRKNVRYETVKVDKGRIVAQVTATGTLSAIVTVQVGSQVSGAISALYADFNSPVKKGELIAKIDDRLFVATVEQARANLAAAQGNLAKAKAQAVDAERQYQRDVILAQRRLIADADRDTAQATSEADKAAVDAAAGAVEQAKAQLNQAQVNLEYTDIRSPKDGTVISRNVDVGQTVAASLQAPILFLIAEDLRKMQVDTSVAESDIGRIKPGANATFTVDAYKAERFTGTVRQVRINPQTVQNVVTYDAVIDVPNVDLRLLPGMTANCTFVYDQRDDALRVPNAAMRFRPPNDLLASLEPGARPGGRRGAAGAASQSSATSETPATSATAPGTQGGSRGSRGPRDGSRPPKASDEKTVWVLRDGNPRPLEIKAGVSDGSLTEVVGGDLKEGDLVITDVTLGAAAGAPGAQANPLARRIF